MSHPDSDYYFFTPNEKLPEDGQECLLMPHDPGGLTTVGVYGPIAWSAKQDRWFDLFRDPEGGSVVSKENVGRWTLWDPIKPREST